MRFIQAHPIRAFVDSDSTSLTVSVESVDLDKLTKAQPKVAFLPAQSIKFYLKEYVFAEPDFTE